MLAHVLASDAQSFTATWYTPTGAVVFAQPYTSLWALAVDEANSRIWGGIHYRFDINGSQVSCTPGGRLFVRQLHAAASRRLIGAPRLRSPAEAARFRE